MASLELDLTLPIALLFGALAGVVAVRALIGRGERRAEARTLALLERHGVGAASDGSRRGAAHGHEVT